MGMVTIEGIITNFDAQRERFLKPCHTIAYERNV